MPKDDNKNNKNKIKRHIEDSDSSEYDSSDNKEIGVHELRQFLHNIFPSKHLKKKIKAGKRLKKHKYYNTSKKNTKKKKDDEDSDESE